MPDNNSLPRQGLLFRTWNDVKGNAKWSIATAIIGFAWGYLIVALTMFVQWLRSQPSGFFGMCGAFALAGTLAIIAFGNVAWRVKIRAVFLLLLAVPSLLLLSRLNFVKPSPTDQLTRPIPPTIAPSPPETKPSKSEADVALKKAATKIVAAAIPPATSMTGSSRALPDRQATPGAPGSVVMNVATGGVGSVGQSGGITAHEVTITGTGVRVNLTMKRAPSIQENTGEYVSEWNVSVDGQVPQLTMYAASPTLVDFRLNLDRPMFASLEEHENPDGSRMVSIGPALGTYTFSVRSRQYEKIQFHYLCAGVTCTDLLSSRP